MAEHAMRLREPQFPDDPTARELEDMAHDCLSGLDAISVIADCATELLDADGYIDRDHCRKMVAGVSIFAKLLHFRLQPLTIHCDIAAMKERRAASEE